MDYKGLARRLFGLCCSFRHSARGQSLRKQVAPFVIGETFTIVSFALHKDK
ncbi:MAG: hypothetical protein M3033_14315 [Acidobacteriota bacterium]|nr:hypothetical protein [Acidobacteriota bacterium]